MRIDLSRLHCELKMVSGSVSCDLRIDLSRLHSFLVLFL
ncbi:hypothetical protein SPONN_1463 [uncultured Candidatus Thioglobus sp.]|nr:hypothetical protein SPONN_1463 [uncultured Candidatus Thioglobus sp.]